MKIIHVYPYYNRLGGVEKYLLDTLPFQSNSGKSIELIGGQFDPDVLSMYTCRRVPFLRRPTILAVMTFVFAAEFRIFRLGKRKTSDMIIHSQGASSFCPDVVTAHSCHKAWFFKSLRNERPFSKAWIKKILNPIHYWIVLVESIQYRRGGRTHVVAISVGIKSELQRYFGLPESRITVIHSGVDCDKYHPSKRGAFRSAIRKQYGIRDEDIVLVFVANEFRRKGLGPLLNGLQRCANPNLKLLVVGRDSTRDFEKLADELNIRSQIIFVGSTPYVDQYYAASDIFVFPTQYEPFGLVATEAMAAGLPVIISELAGAAELMNDSFDCIKLRDPKDPVEIATALKRLESMEAREIMGIKARDSALKHSWGEVVKKLDDIYSLVHSEYTK